MIFMLEHDMAKLAFENDEVPVGALLLIDGESHW